MILRHIFTLRGLQSSCCAMGTAFFGMSAWYLEKDHFVAFGRFMAIEWRSWTKISIYKVECRWSQDDANYAGAIRPLGIGRKQHMSVQTRTEWIED